MYMMIVLLLQQGPMQGLLVAIVAILACCALAVSKPKISIRQHPKIIWPGNES